jgi:ElaB/YqjD/DUF883 family membrane-anchored ribosome-binding protein
MSMLVVEVKKIVAELEALLPDAERAEEGNASAARRVRVALQKAKKSCQETRNLAKFKDVQNG